MPGLLREAAEIVAAERPERSRNGCRSPAKRAAMNGTFASGFRAALNFAVSFLYAVVAAGRTSGTSQDLRCTQLVLRTSSLARRVTLRVLSLGGRAEGGVLQGWSIAGA